MVKVLMIMHNLWGGGGIQKVNMDLAAEIKGVDLTILSLHPKKDDFFDDLIKDKNIKVIYLDKHPGVDTSIIRKIKKIVKEIKPDVIHINQRMTSYALPSLKGIKRKYYVVHNLADMDAKGVARKINNFAFHHLGVVPVAISDICRKSISEVYNIPEKDIPCIYNGVDTERFTRKEEYKAEDMCTFISACTFRPQKNLPLLLNAFAKAHKAYPNSRLMLVGDTLEGEEHIADALKAQAKDLGIYDSIVFAGRQSDMPSWLEKGHVYVMSSDYEGLPITILEAMSMGLPIAATNAGGTSDVMDDNGILVDIGDENGLAGAMIRLAKDKELRERYSKKSEGLAQKYSMKACAENYEKLYKGEL